MHKTLTTPSMADVFAEFGIYTEWRLRQALDEMATQGLAVTEVSAETMEAAETADLAPLPRKRISISTGPAVASPPPAVAKQAKKTGSAEEAEPAKEAERQDLAAIAQMNLPELENSINACRACDLAEERAPVRLSPDLPQPIFWLDSAPQQVPAEITLMRNILKVSGDAVFATAVRCPTPGTRPPSKEEISACRPYLQRELDLRQPRHIFALGRTAALAMLHSDEPSTLGQLRAKDWQIGAAPMTVATHPAQLLSDGEEKKRLWEQLVKCL
jgi:DNA polymerase